VPGHDRVGSDEGGGFTQELETNGLALHGQSESLPSKLLLQDTILLLKVFNDVLLVPIDPPASAARRICQGCKLLCIQ
jgi:hypothetical protein